MLSQPLQHRRIAAALAGQAIGHDVQVFDQLPSTSDHVRELGFSGYPHGLVVFAEQQTHGRGRRDNRWESEPGQDLMFSILLRPTLDLQFWPRMTGMAALALCQAIEETTSLAPMVKWPNDIYLNEKKAAGILAETFTSNQGPFMVLGIGLNVNRIHFAEELTSAATSLHLAVGSPQPREPIAIVLLRKLNQLLPCWEHGHAGVIEGLRSRSLLIGRHIRARSDGREVAGQVTALNDEGHLILSLKGGEKLILTSAEQVRWSAR